VHTGDKVISRDPATGKTEIKTVLNTTVHQVHDLVILHFAGKKHGREIDSVTATPVHPFYVKGKGFVVAGQLAVGNSIVTRAGPNVVIIKIEDVHLEKSVPVYNLTVSDDHTYFVGTAGGGEWVHNAEVCSWTSPGGVRYGRDPNPLFGNRFAHVSDHLGPTNVPGKPTHSIFNVDSAHILDLIDEAWANRGTATASGPNDVYDVNMGTQIGTNGEQTIRLVFSSGTNNIVSAYPK